VSVRHLFVFALLVLGCSKQEQATSASAAPSSTTKAVPSLV